MSTENDRSTETESPQETPPDNSGRSSEDRTGLSSSVKWKIFSGVIAVLGLAFGIIFGVLQLQNREEDIRLEIVQTGSQIFYEWKSNYVSLLYEKRHGEDAASSITGELAITNQLSEPLQNVRVRIAIGFDHDLVVFAYSSEPKALLIFDHTFPLLGSGKRLRISTIERIRLSGFDLRSLFNSHPGAWQQMTDNWKTYFKDAPTIDVGSVDPGGAPFWNRDNRIIQALLGRIIIEYDAGARRYSNVFTLIIGRAFSDLNESSIIFDRELADKRAVIPASQVNKQGYSRVVAPGGKVDVLVVPQTIVNSLVGLSEMLEPGCGLDNKIASDPNLNRFVLTYVWCDRQSP